LEFFGKLLQTFQRWLVAFHVYHSKMRFTGLFS
jgi:hypothetical protein